MQYQNIPVTFQNAIFVLSLFPPEFWKKTRNRARYYSSFSKTQAKKSSHTKHSILKLIGYIRLFYLLCLLTIGSSCYANHRYFLCGPDENGCYEGIYSECFCIPYHEESANTPYCLDFTQLNCEPLSQKPDCPSHLVYANQSACLATIFHSHPHPPCSITTEDFCFKKRTFICDWNGQLDSCRPAQMLRNG